MADPARARRLAKRIMAIVAEELTHRIKDPRLPMVTLTAANVTPDLREATLYYTVYDEANQLETAVALESAKGLLRSVVGRETGIKFTPTLTFIADVLPAHSQHIEKLLAETRARDAELAQQADGAQYAADPNPYREPRSPEETALAAADSEGSEAEI